ncbi:MAG: methionine--tRNA ligase [Patescibacteria group bacterium]
MNKQNKFYITTPIYYVNGAPHIGAAYTTIAADLLARYHRLLGSEVFFLTGTDEHGSKVAQTAEKAGLSPQEFCDLNSAKFQLAWDILDISNDYFIRTTSEIHKQGVTKFLEKLKLAGAIYEGEYEGLYCTGCEAFITEKELINGKCSIHNVEPEAIKEKNYFFDFKKYLPQVERLIDSGRIKILPESKKKETLGLLKQQLNDFSISRQSVKWGIALPFLSDQVVYVWVEALINYVTALGYGGENDENFRKFWPAKVHLMAKDIIKFHALFWPAMLLAAGEEVPEVIYAHGFFTVDGQKMGKSLGNVIDPIELVNRFGSDAVRYLLLSQFPFGADGDVKVGSFVIQYNSDLANGFGNLTSRVTSMAEKYFSGLVPTKDDELKKEVEKIWQHYQESLEIFRVDEAIGSIKKLNALVDGYIDKNKPWTLAKEDPARLAKVMYNLLELLRHLGVMLYPVMPQTATKILQGLGMSDFTSYNLDELKKWGGLSAGTKVAKSEALFPRIE